MLANMDWLTIIPLVVGTVDNVGASALAALAERLVTLLLAVLVIGGVSVFAVTAFTWLWIKRWIGEQHAAPSTARH
jgi:hypothetical protein